jgi:hypothetical protein
MYAERGVRTASVLQSIAFAAAAANPFGGECMRGRVFFSDVKDAQAGVIRGATVVLISETRVTRSSPALTSETGDFVFRTSRPRPIPWK